MIGLRRENFLLLGPKQKSLHTTLSVMCDVYRKKKGLCQNSFLAQPPFFIPHSTTKPQLSQA
ncbi:hypothetical protein, partial [Porphyromonas gulae]